MKISGAVTGPEALKTPRTPSFSTKRIIHFSSGQHMQHKIHRISKIKQGNNFTTHVHVWWDI